MRYREATSVVAALLLPSLHAVASTCSCAGVPLLGTMELASPESGQWYLGTTYEFHDVSELVSGSSTVPDNTGRDRTSQALVFEASRGITEKWSVAALISMVEHERSVAGIQAKADGLGDAIVMVKYAPATISLYSANALSFGLGARIPVGEDDARIGDIVLAEDMQPSTGAYAGIVWAYAARSLNDARSARTYVSVTYTHNGDNKRDYQFGHETTVTLGGAYQTRSPWGFNLELLYRSAQRDERASTQIPNTGGEWLDVVPAMQYHVNESLAFKASAKLPVSRDLNDELQFTTKYAFRVSFSYVFGGQQ